MLPHPRASASCFEAASPTQLTSCAHTRHSRIALEAGPRAMRDRRDCTEEPEAKSYSFKAVQCLLRMLKIQRETIRGQGCCHPEIPDREGSTMRGDPNQEESSTLEMYTHLVSHQLFLVPFNMDTSTCSCP